MSESNDEFPSNPTPYIHAPAVGVHVLGTKVSLKRGAEHSRVCDLCLAIPLNTQQNT